MAHYHFYVRNERQSRVFEKEGGGGYFEKLSRTIAAKKYLINWNS